MNAQRIRAAILAGMLALGVPHQATVWAQADATPEGQIDDGVEPGTDVQLRGPIHEAFAQPAEANRQPSPVIAKEPPDPVPEMPPEQKPEGENVQWIPGYWAWDSDREDFLWVSGFWRVPPPGRKWVPGHWSAVDGGWQWAPGLWAAADQDELQFLEPPPESLDNGPATVAPDANSIYVPGIWVPRAHRYWWRPGFWLPARAGWVWNQAYYAWSPSGVIFNDGFWDLPLENRGILFAPVAFTRPLWLRPGWFYRPSYTVGFGGLFNSWWVRPHWHHYYFGDYYAPTYLGQGFHPWYAWGSRYYDPLFGYYRWQHRGDRDWYAALRNTYWSRRTEEWQRPPRTLAQQNRLVKPNMVINNRQTVHVGNNNHPSLMVTPINRLAPGNVKLSRMSPSQLNQQRSAAKQLQGAAVRRAQVEKPAAFSQGHGAGRTDPNIRAGSFREPVGGGNGSGQAVRAAQLDRPPIRRPVSNAEGHQPATSSYYRGSTAARQAQAPPASSRVVRPTQPSQAYRAQPRPDMSQVNRRAATTAHTPAYRAPVRPTAPSYRIPSQRRTSAYRPPSGRMSAPRAGRPSAPAGGRSRK
jgi:hypothetical protein